MGCWAARGGSIRWGGVACSLRGVPGPKDAVSPSTWNAMERAPRRSIAPAPSLDFPVLPTGTGIYT